MLNKKMNYLMDKPGAKFGGLSISFMGDFRQLTPVGMTPVYENRRAEFCDFVNCFIELREQHRFRDDPEFGKLCGRFHMGCQTAEDFATINSRVVSASNPLPVDVRAGCAKNDQREAIKPRPCALFAYY